MTTDDHDRDHGSDHDIQATAAPQLWPGDTGTLAEGSRRALLRLLQGPYLSGRAHPALWSALVADERAIVARLHELFLDLVIDRDDEFAFTRKVRTADLDVPQALRSESLTFVDTVMLLTLRQMLLSAAGEARVIVGQDEVFERLAMYRRGDEVTYGRNLNSAWTRMKTKFRLIHDVDEGRVEISPVVRFLIDEDRVAALTAVYSSLSPDAPAGVEVDGSAGTDSSDSTDSPDSTDSDDPTRPHARDFRPDAGGQS